MLPGTNINLGNGKLGRIAPSQDGISALIVSGVAVAVAGPVGFALGDVLGPFVQLQDAEAKGITEAYDTANSTNAWKHIKDFYDVAPKGTQLYVMVVGMTQTLTVTCTLATVNGAKKLLAAGNGAIKMLGVTFTPSGAYTPTYVDQLEADLWTAITALKAVWNDEFGYKRPFRAFIEARNYQGTLGSLKNLRNSGTTPNANMVAVVIGNDFNYDNPAASLPYKKKYAAVGAALGAAAGVKVNRNIGRVKSGATLISLGGLSDGTKVNALSDAQKDTLNDLGYVFVRSHVNKSGFYWNDDHTAAPISDDYSQLTLGRTMDKAVRITHAVNTEEILDEINVDPATGKLDVATCKYYQGILENQINAEMTANNELVAVEVFVDPDQNILSTSKLTEVVKLTPTGIGRVIESTLEYNNPLNS